METLICCERCNFVLTFYSCSDQRGMHEPVAPSGAQCSSSVQNVIKRFCYYIFLALTIYNKNISLWHFVREILISWKCSSLIRTWIESENEVAQMTFTFPQIKLSKSKWLTTGQITQSVINNIALSTFFDWISFIFVWFSIIGSVLYLFDFP